MKLCLLTISWPQKTVLSLWAFSTFDCCKDGRLSTLKTTCSIIKSCYKILLKSIKQIFASIPLIDVWHIVGGQSTCIKRKKNIFPWLVWIHCLECHPIIEGLWLGFPVRIPRLQVWSLVQIPMIPGPGTYRRQQLIFLSPPSSLSKSSGKNPQIRI